MDTNNEDMTCDFCKHQEKLDTDYPCNICKHSYLNRFEAECETCKILKDNRNSINISVWMCGDISLSGGDSSCSVSSFSLSANYCPKCGAKL